MIESLVAAIALAVSAQPVPKAQAEVPETLVKLTVDAMPAPKPALRYLLLPDLREQTQGNPIPNYLKCILDQDLSTQQEETLGRAALKQADALPPAWTKTRLAASSLKLKTDGIGLLLPDLQKMRAALQQRHSRAIPRRNALRKFDDAIFTARTMLALSRYMGEHPTVIGSLVAIAIAYVALAPLEEMLEQPGCPNLYWSLTNLPTPFITLDKGMEGETDVDPGGVSRHRRHPPHDHGSDQEGDFVP